MDLTFDNVLNLLSDSVFAGGDNVTALVLLVIGWAVCAVICINLRAPPTYSVVPLIPLALFFNSYGLLNSTIMFIIIIVSSLTVALGLSKVVD